MFCHSFSTCHFVLLQVLEHQYSNSQFTLEHRYSENPTQYKRRNFDRKTGHLTVGSRISVYWPREETWYEGNVTKVDTYTGHYTVSYDDGDVVTHENFVRGLQWKLVNNSKAKRDSRKSFKNEGIFLCEGGHVPRRIRCTKSKDRVCDKCNSEILQDSILFRCMACDWDYCEKCGPDQDDGEKEDACTRVGLLLAIQRRQREALKMLRQTEKTDLGRSFVKHNYDSAINRLGDSNNTEAIGADDTNQHRCMRCKGT